MHYLRRSNSRLAADVPPCMKWWEDDDRKKTEVPSVKGSFDHCFPISRLAVSSSLWPPGLQHARLPYPLLSLSLLKLVSIESMMPSNHLILTCSLLLLPSIFPSIRVFSSEPAPHIRWQKYWSFSLNEHTGLISFRIGLFDLLAVQETLKSLLQHHNSKAAILRHWVFFMVQLSHPYMTIVQRGLSNLMKLWVMPCRATQGRWVIVKKVKSLSRVRLFAIPWTVVY